jgi:polyhydroxybutyrate depolymerase
MHLVGRAPQLPAGTVEVGLRHQGRARQYLLHAPAGPRTPAPLLLELHGRGIGPIMFDRWTGFSALADEEGFVLAMPSAIGEVWNDGRYRGPDWPEHQAIDDVGYLLAVIDDVAGQRAIDPARIYVVGMSNGATMAGRLAWEHAERIAAVAQVAGTAAAEIVAQHDPATPLPLLEIHGSRDRSVPYDGGRAALWMRLFVRRPSRPVLSVDEWARRWVDRNGAVEGPLVETVGPDVTVRRWRGPSAASDLAFYRVEGGGHTWPGAREWMPPHLGRVSRSLDATRVSWGFLYAHRRAV